jgi:RimJ/RimL family protein N-acetyltransferase
VTDLLCTNQNVWLIHTNEDPAAPDGYQLTPRPEFYDCGLHTRPLNEFRGQLPEGYEIQLIDRNLLERCEWGDDMAFYYAILETFLRYGLGLCLMHGDKVIFETYSSALGNPYAEIGPITQQPYRGKGVATITAAFLIEELEKRGYQAYWSRDVDNPASARVARKLGFRVEKPYEIWEHKSQVDQKWL